MSTTHFKEILKVDQLYWKIKDKSILTDLNFFINSGEFVGIIGPNGSGKSSLLRCLYRKNIPTSGNIQFDDRPLTSYSRNKLARKIAVVLQEPPTQFDLSVIDVIGMGLIPNKSLLAFDTQDDRQKIIKSAAQVSLTKNLQQSFNSLSGGEKQRVMIARAMLQEPQLLLMDEPTNHLDIQHQIQVLDYAKAMGITVLVSIHDLNLAASFCDKLILLDQGKIVAQGTPPEVITETIITQVFKVRAHIDRQAFNQKLRISFNLNSNNYSKKTSPDKKYDSPIK